MRRIEPAAAARRPSKASRALVKAMADLPVHEGPGRRPDAQEPLRALTVMDTVPAGHTAVMVRHGRLAPHLRLDELAIVDTADVEPQHGELYAISYRAGPALTQARKDKIQWTPKGKPGVGWWCTSSLYRATGAEDAVAALRSGIMSLSDGPYKTDHLRSKLLGRVVGVLIPMGTEAT